MKNIILFLFMGSNKEILRSVSQQMEVDNLLVYKSKRTGSWFKWEKESIGRPEALTKDEVFAMLSNYDNRIINWGCHILLDQGNIILNKPSSCAIGSNKWATRKVWQENNIKTPFSSNVLSDMVTFPFIARPHKHARQLEFHVINNIGELLTFTATNLNRDNVSENWYFQKIVQKTCEFRVYVTGDKVATIFWKGNGDQLLSSNQEWHWLDDVNWNEDKLPSLPIYTEGYRLETFKKDIERIKEECIKATKVLGLNYSGIDVGLNCGCECESTINLFESNTDPELTALPIKKFAKYFDSVLTQSISDSL